LAEKIRPEAVRIRDMDEHDAPETQYGNRKKQIGVAVAMVLIGIFLTITTVYTLIGPLIGLFLIGFGIYVGWRSGRAARPPV
jgi:uncharacterized membrane protein